MPNVNQPPQLEAWKMPEQFAERFHHQSRWQSQVVSGLCIESLGDCSHETLSKIEWQKDLKVPSCPLMWTSKLI